MTRGAHVLAILLPVAAALGAVPEDTLRIYPENPHYLAWRGKPLLVVGSGEHYGAVLNADFDFRKYLTTLGSNGLNHTRLFTGAAYVEPPGAFNIERNTLAPRPSKYIAPWARSTESGYAGGGNKFDLGRWDPAYFARLRDFMAEAARNRVIVEVNLFCPFYGEEQWRVSPFHPGNNIQRDGMSVSRTNVYTLDKHGGLLPYQEQFVRRIVAELREFDNFYYEVCNEPYFGGVTPEWQAHIAAIIADAQASHPNPKLISQNIANKEARVDEPLRNIAIYNFHYASPPHTVALNWHLNLPMGDNETGFSGTENAPYRMEAWDFLLAGGALFSHLDYSFAIGREDGTFSYPSSQPGGGNPTLRREFKILRDFLEGFEFTKLAPQNDVVAGGVPPSHVARGFGHPDLGFAIYMRPNKVPGKDSPLTPSGPLQSIRLELKVPIGSWRAMWIDPLSGSILKEDRLRHNEGALLVEAPPFVEDIALKLVRR